VLVARIHCFFITYRFNLVLLNAFRRSAVFNQLCLIASAAVIRFLCTEIILNYSLYIKYLCIIVVYNNMYLNKEMYWEKVLLNMCRVCELRNYSANTLTIIIIISYRPKWCRSSTIWLFIVYKPNSNSLLRSSKNKRKRKEAHTLVNYLTN